MAKLIVNEDVLAVVETTPGTTETTSGTNYVRAISPTASLEGNRTINREGIAGGSQGMDKPLFGGTAHSLQTSWEVAAGTSTSPIPEHDAFYQAVGLLLDNTTDTDVAAYSLQSDANAMKTITVAYNQDGVKRVFKGMRASAFSIAGTAGDTLKCDATFIGEQDTETDEALPTVVRHPTTPLIVTSIALSVGGSASYIVDEFSIDFGLTTELGGDVNRSNGYTLPRITQRNITFTLNPERVSVSTKNWLQTLKDKTNTPISFEIGTSFTSQSTGSGRIRVNIPNAVLTELGDGDKSGVRTDEITLQAHRVNGNDELTIQFD